MAKLLKPREEVKKAIAARIRAGNDLTAKAEIAESTGGYEDWLFLFAKWREETATELHSMAKETSGGTSPLSQGRQITHPRASPFHIEKEHWS